MLSSSPEANHVEIYTDGGCDPNPGPGGWGAVLLSGGRTKEMSGAEPKTTNNRMELTAAIEALRSLKRPCTVDLYTDSTYLRDGITRWMQRWQAQDWQKADRTPVENVDLWRALLNAMETHDVSWHWVRGHRGHRWNERADQLATAARQHIGQTGWAPGASLAVERKEPSASQLPQYDLYVRGCALGNPGPGGYGAVVRGASGEYHRSGGWPVATNNVMDLWAVVAALQSLPGPAHAVIHTPSKYVIDGATRWLSSWERSGWRTQAGHPVKNQQMWQELATVMGDHDIEWHYLATAESEPHSALALELARGEAEAQRAAAGAA